MRPRPPVKGRGIFSGTGLIVTGLAATLAALVFPVWSYADRSGPGVDNAQVFADRTIPTPYGPLSVPDRDFVVRVRLAGLWELPAGRLAEEKGTTDAVRVAGQHLIDGHTFLDERVRDVAADLGLPLPNQPTGAQKQWLDSLEAAQGEDFDRRFANILRLAHGRVFSVVADVRASTRNSLVRTLADDANTTVLDHIEVLEGTGFVDFDALAREMAASPTPASPDPVPPAPVADPAPAVPVAPAGGPGDGWTLPPAATGPPPSR
jgi:predicted outer membrane protein